MSFSIKNLGVFGDSFSYVKEKSSHFNWVNLLVKKLCCDHSNYSLGAVSFYHTFLEFKKNYKKHDFNLILVTDPYRYTKKIYIESEKNYFSVNNVPSVENLLSRYKVSENEKSILHNILGWHLAKDDNYILDMHVLMLNEIKFLDPYVFFIPCFANSLPDYDDICLEHLVKFQIEKLGGDFRHISNYTENEEFISSHFAEEMNVYMAQAIFDSLNNKELKLSLPEIDFKHDLHTYYMKIL